MSMDTIVNVQVTRETRAPSQRGFGIPMLVAFHEAWSARVLEVSDETELVDAGMSTSHFIYKTVAAMKAQTPSPSRIKIGRRSAAFTQVVHLIPRELEVGFVHSVTVDGVTYTYEVDTGDDAGDVVDGLVAAMSAAPGLTVTDGTTHVVVTSTAPGIVHSFVAKRGLDMLDATTNPGLLNDLVAIRQADTLLDEGASYGFLLDSNSAAQITVLSTFLESQIALGLVQSADWNVRDAGQTNDIASTMQASAYTRTGGLYHQEIGTPAAAAWMAKELPKNPGLSSWAHKTLSIVPADKLTGGEQSAINAKKWSHYTRVGGQNITFEGATPAGEFLDIMHQVDFSTARVQESVFGTFTGNDKVPQTDMGIDMVRGNTLTALKLCSSPSYPIFDPASIIVRPLTMADIDQADRANRILRGIAYEGRLTGAFHRVVVRGRVYV